MSRRRARYYRYYVTSLVEASLPGLEDSRPIRCNNVWNEAEGHHHHCHRRIYAEDVQRAVHVHSVFPPFFDPKQRVVPA